MASESYNFNENVAVVSQKCVWETPFAMSGHILFKLICVNTLRPRHDGRHFPDDILKWIFLSENL